MGANPHRAAFVVAGIRRGNESKVHSGMVLQHHYRQVTDAPLYQGSGSSRSLWKRRMFSPFWPVLAAAAAAANTARRNIGPGASAAVSDNSSVRLDLLLTPSVQSPASSSSGTSYCAPTRVTPRCVSHCRWSLRASSEYTRAPPLRGLPPSFRSGP